MQARPDLPGQTHLIPALAGPLSAVMIRQNQPVVCWLRHLALFAAHVLEYALLSMPVRLARLANGHGPLGRLPVGFRAKSAIFLAGTQQSCFSRCDAGALAVTRLRRERLRQAADAATASAFFRLLPAPAIRLRFAPAEQRWLRFFLSVLRSLGG